MDIIRVVIADDHALFREGLRRVLSQEKDILVVGEASTGAEAVAAVKKNQPDILLLDLKMPDELAVRPLLQITSASPATKVMILTAFGEDQYVLESARGRARGYILKGVATATLVEAIRKVHAGEVWVDQELPRAGDFKRIARSQSFVAISPANETLDSLSKRELEILQLVAQGLTNEEIGKTIFISPKTVKTHLNNIFDKLQVKNRFKAALLIMGEPPHRNANR
jgi:DNA-binding NarL/FixJ family response regulator